MKTWHVAHWLKIEVWLKRFGTNLGARITTACEGSLVATSFLVGLISVEDSSLKETVTRFEERIFAKLKRVRDGQRPSFNGVKTSDIAERWCPQKLVYIFRTYLDSGIARDRDLQQYNHRQRLARAAHLRDREFEKVLRIHNTDRPDGETFDSGYVPNALEVMDAYQA